MNFIRIDTLFDGKTERSIKELSKLYSDKFLLKEKIHKVGEGILDNEFIIKGKKILLKPNWVTNNRKEEDEICLRTHNNFLISALEILLENKPASITIGDAPIQGCNWEKIISPQLQETIAQLSISSSVPITIKDFRRVTFDPIKNIQTKERNPLSDFIVFDLGNGSYLEPVSTTKPVFRVNDYDHDRLAESHTLGKHKYCVIKELFEADVIISIPKIKTHQKTGITGALKNIVGLNGDKDFLPHHRVGGDKNGGDCYPGRNILRLISEYTIDNANKNQGKQMYRIWYWMTAILWKLSRPKNVHNLSAGWFGNDTCWRMVMDLNKVLIYGKKDGSISVEPQRIIYSLCDGIVGGQGDGPLNPQPLPLGIISFSNNSSLTDICMSTIMGFEYKKFPLLQSALLNIQNQESEIFLNEEKSTLSDLLTYTIPTIPPPGWIDYLLK